MTITEPSVILASGSPRRLDLLRSIGWNPEVIKPDVDESMSAAESPRAYVARLARQKADAVASTIDLDASTVVIAADTTVDVDGVVLGKPVDDADAIEMITMLSGRAHLVHTGVAAVGIDRHADTVVTTTVTFTKLNPERIAWYVGVGESRDKAGGYAIQGAGAALIERIDGSPSNVIGLPLAETIQLVDDIVRGPR